MRQAVAVLVWNFVIALLLQAAYHATTLQGTILCLFFSWLLLALEAMAAWQAVKGLEAPAPVYQEHHIPHGSFKKQRAANVVPLRKGAR